MYAIRSYYEIPSSMSRLQAVTSTAPTDRPLVVMDTAPAAVLGALEDAHVGAHWAANAPDRRSESWLAQCLDGKGQCHVRCAPANWN